MKKNLPEIGKDKILLSIVCSVLFVLVSFLSVYGIVWFSNIIKTRETNLFVLTEMKKQIKEIQFERNSCILFTLAIFPDQELIEDKESPYMLYSIYENLIEKKLLSKDSQGKYIYNNNYVKHIDNCINTEKEQIDKITALIVENNFIENYKKTDKSLEIVIK